MLEQVSLRWVYTHQLLAISHKPPRSNTIQAKQMQRSMSSTSLNQQPFPLLSDFELDTSAYVQDQNDLNNDL